MQIGLTGLIGAGKTTVANIFAELGAKIIDADVLTREVLSENVAFISELKKIFPENVFYNESINKKEIARIIFNDQNKKNEYEKLIHPEIDKLYKKKLSELINIYGEDSIIIYDAPLLFEVGYTLKDFSQIILIIASKENCLKRIVARNNCSKEEALLRFNSQISPEKKKLMADIIINNDDSLEKLQNEINQIWLKITKEDPSRNSKQ